MKGDITMPRDITMPKVTIDFPDTITHVFGCGKQQYTMTVDLKGADSAPESIVSDYTIKRAWDAGRIIRTATTEDRVKYLEDGIQLHWRQPGAKMPLSNDELIQELVDKGMTEDAARAVVDGIKPRDHKLVKKGEDRKAA
jgi:hypothetical protein